MRRLSKPIARSSAPTGRETVCPAAGPVHSARPRPPAPTRRAAARRSGPPGRQPTRGRRARPAPAGRAAPRGGPAGSGWAGSKGLAIGEGGALPARGLQVRPPPPYPPRFPGPRPQTAWPRRPRCAPRRATFKKNGAVSPMILPDGSTQLS